MKSSLDSLRANTEFVYTLSSNNNMVKEVIRSINTLLNYTDEESIHVFYTPPHRDEDEQVLRDLGVNLHVEAENQTEGFRSQGMSDERYFGEKTRLCKIDSENVVFLDCDTLVLGDIWKVIEGDFDFKGRADSSGIDQGWKELFSKYDEPYMDWMPNAGFLIFKDNSHKKIEADWKSYLGKDLDYESGEFFPKEQIALSLAVSGLEIEKMSEQEHVFEGSEKVSKGIVYHLAVESTDTYPVDEVLAVIDRRIPIELRKTKIIQNLRDRIVDSQ